MRHPFEGIEPETKSSEQSDIRTRRSFFALAAGTVAAGVAGVIGLSSSANAQATSQLRPGFGRPMTQPPITTRMVGEEGGRPPRRGWKK